MEATTGNKLINRDEITDATLATFADSAVVIPDRYLRSDEVHDGIVVAAGQSYELPTIDMARLLDPECSEEEIAKLGSACREWGFFQLTNHGVDEAVVQNMKDNIVQFFGLPLEKKNAVSIQEDGVEGFGHHFNRSSGDKLDWAESLLLRTQRPEHRKMSLWPTEPSTFRDALDRYSEEMVDLAIRLMVFMTADLQVEPETLMEAFRGKRQSVGFHHYPPCRQPEKVLGIPSHSDALGLTLLLHVNDAQGLQVKKDGRWLPLRPLPGAFVVNVGDILQVLTNGAYKSVEHRVLVDAERGRFSIVMFQDASVDGVVKPLPELGEARYKSIQKRDYIKGSFDAVADGSRFLESLEI